MMSKIGLTTLEQQFFFVPRFSLQDVRIQRLSAGDNLDNLHNKFALVKWVLALVAAATDTAASGWASDGLRQRQDSPKYLQFHQPYPTEKVAFGTYLVPSA